MNRSAWALFAALAGASCSQPFIKLPAGPGAPAPDAQSALADATASCRAVMTLTAEITVKGSLDRQRIRAQMFAGFAAPASARLEAVAPFGPLFVLVARENDGTLLLPHDNRVLEHGPPAEILAAIAGLPLSASDLRTTMTGCAPAGGRGARHHGEDWIVVEQDGAEIYLHRTAHDATWRLVAAIHHGGVSGDWRREYQDFRSGIPAVVRVASVGSNRFDLQLSLSQVETNVALKPDVFEVRIPPSAAPITLDELRGSGLLGQR